MGRSRSVVTAIFFAIMMAFVQPGCDKPFSPKFRTDFLADVESALLTPPRPRSETYQKTSDKVAADFGLPEFPSWIVDGDQILAAFGRAVSGAGDVNGDGYDDVIVGALSYSQDYSDQGRAVVYHGSVSGLESTPSWTAEGDQAFAHFGWSVSRAGDVNGDGYDDVVIGAYPFHETDEFLGWAAVYLGSSAGLESEPSAVVVDDQLNSGFGISVSDAGDVNGDGYGDVVIGAPRRNNADTTEGRVYVYLGSSTGLESSPSSAIGGESIIDGFGYSVSGAGDVNNDGYDDVLVGSYRHSHDQLFEGRAYLYPGSSDGLSETPAWTADGGQDFAQFGWSASGAGDVNGDGFDDVIVGAWRYTFDLDHDGRASIYLGSNAGLSETPAWMASGDQADTWYGFSVSGAGDVDNDGFDDVIVGAPTYENGEDKEGRAFVYGGSADGVVSSPIWFAESNSVGAYFADAVSDAGDVNNDGAGDVIVGAPFFRVEGNPVGRVYVYHGNGPTTTSISTTTTTTTVGDDDDMSDDDSTDDDFVDDDTSDDDSDDDADDDTDDDATDDDLIDDDTSDDDSLNDHAPDDDAAEDDPTSAGGNDGNGCGG